MNDGKHIEKLVRLIQETLKDSPNTNIFSNYRIPNRSFKKREIDVLIETQVNDITLRIAIECKDNARPVPSKELEAFNSKCERIKGINKKVFVSSSGYQSGAIDAAEDFDIDLYNLRDISPKIIQYWLPFKRLKHKMILHPSKIDIIGDTQEITENLPYKNDQMIYIVGEKEPKHLLKFIWSMVMENHSTIWAGLIYDFLKRKPNTPVDKRLNIPFELKLEGVYVIGLTGKKFFLDKITSAVDVWFEEMDPNITETKIYEDINGKEKAQIVTLGISQDEQTDIVTSSNNKISFFHTDRFGVTTKLEELFQYDPKTGKIIEINKNGG
jgi:hypothetical protein